MIKLHPKYVSGIVAVTVYVGIIGLMALYVEHQRTEQSTHFVTRNSHAIAVTLHAPTHTPSSTTTPKTPRPISKPKTHSKHPHQPKPLLSPHKKHPKPSPKKSHTKPTKRINAKQLFAHVHTTHSPQKKHPAPANTSPAKPKPSHSNRTALKQQQARDKGIENRYLAHVQDQLYGWPAQTNFAGAAITIGLTIHPSGRFDYVVLQHSTNPDFDRTILQYLKQLRSTGFGPTPKKKHYKFKVEIVAK